MRWQGPQHTPDCSDAAFSSTKKLTMPSSAPSGQHSGGALPAAAWPEETWKIDAGDVNDDGHPDLFFANIFFQRTDAVLHNRLLIMRQIALHKYFDY